MNHNEFNKYYLNTLLEKLAMEKKTVRLGNFNINLLEHEKHNPIIEFVDSLSLKNFYHLLYSLVEEPAILKL